MSKINNDVFKQTIEKHIAAQGYSPEVVGKLAFSYCMSHLNDIDQVLYDKLMDIANMENGPEFEMTEKEFKAFLDKI